MKNLAIHKLLWFIIVVVFTLFEGIVFLISWVIYIVWNFKYLKILGVNYTISMPQTISLEVIHIGMTISGTLLLGVINTHGTLPDVMLM